MYRQAFVYVYFALPCGSGGEPCTSGGFKSKSKRCSESFMVITNLV
jgi:hypothetical protein